MKRITSILLLLSFTTLFSQENERYVLQVATLTSEKYLEIAKKKFSQYKLMSRKIDKYIVLYALDLSQEEVDAIKKRVPDAIVKLTYTQKKEQEPEPVEVKKELETKPIVVASQALPSQVKPLPSNATTNIDMNDFQKARLLYSQRNYKTALLLFESFANSPIEPKRLDFYVGRCHYELKNYEQALAAYERILMQDPENLRVKLELAQTYLQLNLLKEAKEEYLAVLENKEVPEEVKKNINLQLALIASKTKKHFINITGIFGIGYDSNIDNGTDTQSYSVFVPQLNTSVPISSAKQIGAVLYEYGAVLNHVYKVNNNFFVQNGVTLYMQRYQNSKTKDIQVFSLSTTPTYSQDKNMYSLTMSVDHIWYGHVNFLNNYSLKPKYSRSISKTLLYDISLKYSRKDFYNPNEDKNSDAYELSNKLSYVNKDYGLFLGEVVLADEKRIRGTRTDVSKEYYFLKLSNIYKYTPTLLLNTNINHENYQYKYTDVNFLNKREDKKTSYSFGVTNINSKQLTLNLSAQYIKNKSNQAPFAYDKYVLKSSVNYNF